MPGPTGPVEDKRELVTLTSTFYNITLCLMKKKRNNATTRSTRTEGKESFPQASTKKVLFHFGTTVSFFQQEPQRKRLLVVMETSPLFLCKSGSVCE